MSKVNINQEVPDFSGPLAGGGTFKLSDFEGKNLVLVFNRGFF